MTPEDRAQAIELAEYERTQEAAIMPAAMAPSATHCTDPACGDAIPEARRLAVPGVQLCADCQGRREQTKRTRGW